MSEGTTTIPSIAESIKATTAQVVAESQPQQTQQVKQPDTSSDSKSEGDKSASAASSESSTVRKSLAESVLSDASESSESKPVDAQVDEVQRKDGENDSQFIKRMKAELKQHQQELKQLREKKPDFDPSQLTELQKQLQERDQLIEREHFSKSKKFQEGYVAPVQKAEKNAKELISKMTETKGVYERALALDGRERLDYLKEHLEDGAAVAFDRISRVEELARDRDEALDTFSKQAKELMSQQQMEESAAISREFDATWEQLGKQVSAFRGEQGEALKQEAMTLLDGSATRADVLSAAPLAVWAARVGMPMIASLQAEVNKLKARVAEQDGDRASIAGRGGDAASAAGKVSFFGSDGKPLPIRQVMGGLVRETLASQKS